MASDDAARERGRDEAGTAMSRDAGIGQGSDAPDDAREASEAPASTAPGRRTFLRAGATMAALPFAAGCASAGRDGEAVPAGLADAGSGRRILLKGGTVVTMDAATRDLVRGDVLIEGKRIAAIGPTLNAGDAVVIDATDTIVMPGFVDAHRHSWMAALRGLIPNADIGRYMQETHRSLAMQYRPDDIYIGNLMTALGCIDAGITCIIDNSHNSRTAAHSDAAIKGLMDSGIRAVHASGAPRVDGPWDKQWPADIDRLRKQYFSSDDQLVTLGMYADLVPEMLQFARDRGLRLSTELTPGQARALEEMGARGLLGPTVVYNHCNGIPDTGWRVLRDTGGKVNVCARSDAQYVIAEGLTPIQKARDLGMRPALSVDGETSYSTSMFTEMSVAYMMQRAMVASRRFAKDAKPPAPMTVREILACATVHGAECAGLERKVGSLAPGKEADVVMVRTDDRNTWPLNNALATVVNFAEIANVDTVLVGGRVRKYRGRLVGVDVAKLRRELIASRDAVFARSNYKPDIFSA